MLGKWEHCEGYAVSSPPPRGETEFSSAIDSLPLLGSDTSIPLWITHGLWGVVDLRQIPLSGTHWHHGSLVSPPPQAEEPFSSGNMKKSHSFPKLLFVTQDEKIFSKGPDSKCFCSLGHLVSVTNSQLCSSHTKAAEDKAQMNGCDRVPKSVTQPQWRWAGFGLLTVVCWPLNYTIREF